MRKFPLHASRFSLPCWYGSVLAACTPNRSIVRSGQFVQTNRSAKDSAPGDVYALAQTTDGFLWLGTMQGLCRGSSIRCSDAGGLPVPRACMLVRFRV